MFTISQSHSLSSSTSANSVGGDRSAKKSGSSRRITSPLRTCLPPTELALQHGFYARGRHKKRERSDGVDRAYTGQETCARNTRKCIDLCALRSRGGYVIIGFMTSKDPFGPLRRPFSLHRLRGNHIVSRCTTCVDRPCIPLSTQTTSCCPVGSLAVPRTRDPLTIVTSAASHDDLCSRCSHLAHAKREGD